jgi:branched-chain amino acid transport system permease protein
VFELFSSYEYLVDTVFIDTLLALSLYVAFNAGLLSLASVGFMAVGAYVSSLLDLNFNVPSAISVSLGACLAAVLAGVFGFGVLRLRGIYLALGSLALAQAIVMLIANVDYTGGTQGLIGIPISTQTWQLICLLVAVCGILQLLGTSRHGRALRAIRLDERTALGLGVNVFRYRLGAFTLSGGLAGLAGGLEAHLSGVISPDQYGLTLLVAVLTFAVVGGPGHWGGTVLAAFALRALQEVINSTTPVWELAFFGLVLIFCMLAMPNGISGLHRWSRHGRASAKPSSLTANSAGGGAK